MPQNVLKFVLSRKYENSAHIAAYLVTDKASSKNSSTTVSAQSRAFWRVDSILDESPIFSLEIEQNHSSPITKFITDLTSTLLCADLTKLN